MREGREHRIVTWWVTGLALVALAAASTHPCRAQTTVFIVRHAEQGGMPANNPHLTDAGKARAARLAQMLRSVRLTAVLSSEFERTIETVQPTADAKNLAVARHRARDVAGLAKRILTEYAGGTLLVAGHSDTIPALLSELGVDHADIPKIAHDEFDNLFVLFICKSGDVTFQRLHYGAPPEAQLPPPADSKPSKAPADG